jgi:hypothetical protein
VLGNVQWPWHSSICANSENPSAFLLGRTCAKRIKEAEMIVI